MNDNKKYTLNLNRIIFLLLFAASITMSLIIYGERDAFSVHAIDHTFQYQAITSNELPEDNEIYNNTLIIPSISKNDKSGILYKTCYNLLLAAIIGSLYFFEFLLFVIIIYFITFQKLPNDWTLINLKIRLND